MRLWRYARNLLRRRPAQIAEVPGIGKSFVERSVTIDGADYRYRVFVPPGWSKESTWPVILSLHGAGAYGSDGVLQMAEGLAPAIRRHPERFPVLAVFPQSPANGTPGWQQIGGRIALAALDSAMREFGGDPSRVALTGLSVGGNGVWYLAYHHPRRFNRLLAVCGYVAERMGMMVPILYPSVIAGETDPSAAIARQLAHLPTWIVHGDADTTVPVEHSRRMAAALRALGAPVRYDELRGVDHNSWDHTYARPEVISWLVQQPRAD